MRFYFLEKKWNSTYNNMIKELLSKIASNIRADDVFTHNECSEWGSVKWNVKAH